MDAEHTDDKCAFHLQGSAHDFKTVIDPWIYVSYECGNQVMNVTNFLMVIFNIFFQSFL